jgi:hypothetical protein
MKTYWHWLWWHTPVILALGRLRMEDPQFKASLSYIAKSCLKKKKGQKKKKQ